MAATIARATGEDKSGRLKTVTRLGSKVAMGEANTWRTFATAYVNAAGAGYVEVIRDGNTIGRISFGAENAPLDVLVLGPTGPVKSYT